MLDYEQTLCPIALDSFTQYNTLPSPRYDTCYPSRIEVQNLGRILQDSDYFFVAVKYTLNAYTNKLTCNSFAVFRELFLTGKNSVIFWLGFASSFLLQTTKYVLQIAYSKFVLWTC